MRKIQNLLFVIYTVLCISSCKKDNSQLLAIQVPEKIDNSTSRGRNTFRVPTYLLYDISQQSLQDSMEVFFQNFRANNNLTQRPIRCGSLLDFTSIITNIYHTGSFCDINNPATVYITYRNIGIEWSATPGTFTFSSNLPIPGTSPISIIQQPDIDLSTPTNPFTAKIYDVEYILNGNEYTINGGSTNTMTRTSCTNLESLSRFTSFSLPSIWYTLRPAIIYVFPLSNGQLRVSNQCNVILCSPPYITECPITGIFKYKIAGTNVWTTVIMDNNFYTSGISGLTSGLTYDYECVLTYSAGQTLPTTGTFILP